MYVSIVTSSTPMPMPPMNRQRFTMSAVCWNARMSVAMLYQTSEKVKIARRPKRSAK